MGKGSGSTMQGDVGSVRVMDARAWRSGGIKKEHVQFRVYGPYFEDPSLGLLRIPARRFLEGQTATET